MEDKDISELIGKIITQIDNNSDEIIFHCENEKYKMYHSQDCCENVSIDDIEGDLNDLLNTPILQAEEVSNPEYEKEWLSKQEYQPESFTWTFYKLATVKGYVTIKWLGESNGYYSESVEFVKI